MASVTICSDFGAQENKVSHCSIVSPSICHEVMGLDAMILVFWMLSFKLTFSLSSFTFINRLFSSSSLSAKRVVSSAYLRLLIFLPEILIPACASSSLAFWINLHKILDWISHVFQHIYTHTHMYIHIYFFHYRLLQDIEYSFLCYTVHLCCLSVFYILMLIC